MKKSFDPTKPAQTRDGRKVRIIATDRNSRRPIVALVVSSGTVDYELISTHFSDGRLSAFVDFSGDLVNIPTFDPVKPVKTRDGHEARIICTDRAGEFPIIALIRCFTATCDGSHEVPQTYTAEGKRSRCPGQDHRLDLVNVPPYE